MLRLILAAALALCCAAADAHQPKAICDNLDPMRPCAYQPNFLAGIRSINVKMHRTK